MASVQNTLLGCNWLGNARHSNSSSINMVLSRQPSYSYYPKATIGCTQLSVAAAGGGNKKKKNKDEYWDKDRNGDRNGNRNRNRRVCCSSSNDGSCGIAPPPPEWSRGASVLDLILDFYAAINVKDTHKLDQLLSHDAVFQDLIFYIPFSGKQSIIKFLEDLMEAMGQNVHFVIDSLMEGERLTASVAWHLEWKGKEIPFTNGCNFFECEHVDEKLIIRKITGIEEFPVKPGDLVLKLLKAVSNVFDSFPLAAEELLSRSRDTHEGLIIKLLEMVGAYKKK